MIAFRKILAITVISVSTAFIAPAAHAQNISGVSGADVKPGDNTFEYRAGFSPANDGREEGFAHRFSFQHAFDDRWRARVILLQSERGGAALKTRSISVEVMNQFVESENSGGWDSAIRVDGLIPAEHNRPGHVRAAWINGFDLGDDWAARANVYVGKEIGDLAKDGLTLATREEITYAYHGVKIGAQLFDKYNTTAHIGSFDSQTHQIGPVLKGKLSKHLKYETSALFGLSAAASDVDLRFFVSYSL